MLVTPHIPLRISLSEGLRILGAVGEPVHQLADSEPCWRVDGNHFSVAIYRREEVVGSVWYDDPNGRDTELLKLKKIEAYLARYGALKHWEMRMDNGWMRYWFNAHDKASMVYGVHMDVLRFNAYDSDA